MNVSVTERVLNRGTYSGAEAEELAIAAGGGLSIHKDNTLQILRERELSKQRKEKEAQSEAALKAKLMKQQEDFRKEKAGGGAKAKVEEGGGGGGKKKIEEETPLPPGWEAVPDPAGSGDAYYWHATSNATTWERPKATAAKGVTVAPTAMMSSSSSSLCSNSLGGSKVASTTTAAAAVAGGGGGAGGGCVSVSVSDLPPGWKEVKHAATGQVCYVHETSNLKRWTKPTAADDLSSDIQQTRQAHADAARQQQQQQQQQRGGKIKKRGREGEEVDPMDPTGGKGGGGWTQGLGGDDRMADSTAGGSLWQQRPLPAPGAVLRKQGGGGGGGRGGGGFQQQQQGPTMRR